jgi:hypothetical protein
VSYREPWKDEPYTKWEPIAENPDLRRIKVSGGWLYRTSTTGVSGVSVALLFVADKAATP